MTSAHVKSLLAFVDPEDESALNALETALASMHPTTANDDELDTLFGVFERFPEHDGFGVFWSILHFLEACPGCEAALLRSVTRKPVEFNVMMINRLINGGGGSSGVDALLRRLEHIRDAAETAADVRTSAFRFLNYQRQRLSID
jgi:hypothetical protein